MTYTAIAHDGQGYRVYRTDTGIDRRYVGPRWSSPKEAAAYADLIDVPYVSPRASTEATPANTGPTPHGSVDGAVASVESRSTGTPGEEDAPAIGSPVPS